MIIHFMDKNKTWSISSFESLREQLFALGTDYSRKSLHANAAILAFLLASEEEREEMIGLVEKARRAAGSGTIWEKANRLMGRIQPNVEQGKTDKSLGVVAEAVDEVANSKKSSHKPAGQSHRRKASGAA